MLLIDPVDRLTLLLFHLFGYGSDWEQPIQDSLTINPLDYSEFSLHTKSENGTYITLVVSGTTPKHIKRMMTSIRLSKMTDLTEVVKSLEAQLEVGKKELAVMKKRVDKFEQRVVELEKREKVFAAKLPADDPHARIKQCRERYGPPGVGNVKRPRGRGRWLALQKGRGASRLRKR